MTSPASGETGTWDDGAKSGREREQEDIATIAVAFEVWPEEGRYQEPLGIAAGLRPLLDRIDGFVSIERFERLSEPGKVPSLPF